MATTDIDQETRTESGQDPTKTYTEGGKPTRSVGSGIRMYVGVVLIVIWGLAPFYWMMITAFRQVDFTHVTWDNFQTVFSTRQGNHFGRALANSVIISTAATVVGLLFGVSAAYALA